jgi:c-di-GMP-binding flagellar brake protein YcgR
MTTIMKEQKPTQRLAASLIVALSAGAAIYIIDTENVSDTGLCLSPKKVFPVGTELHLVFGKPPDLAQVSVQGIVRWSEGGKGVGVEFTSISPDARRALLRYVNSQSHREQA